ncbi:MAG: TRAP transporter substrate-binding protein DctP [Treponema sp.]|nr:TRAP transporter substrate-binding protein DctP [Treponema sp.]
MIPIPRLIRRLFRPSGLLIVILLATPGIVRSLEIKLASSLPQNSDWGVILDRIAADWHQATNGEVELKVYHSRAGSEKQYLNWIRQDRIQAGIFTSSGLFSVAPEVMALSIPFLINNNQEFDAVIQETRPILDASIEEKGYKNLVLIKAGWLGIFSRSPVYTVEDLRKIKLACNPDDEKFMDAFKGMGFQLVGVTMTEVPQYFISRRIDAVYQSPIAAQVTQFHKMANNMSSINLAPFMGGILMSRKAWESIPERYRGRLQDIVRKAGVEIENSFQKREAEAVEAMKKDGMRYNEIPPQQTQVWYADMASRIPALVDKGVFNKDMYLRIQRILERYRGGR